MAGGDVALQTRVDNIISDLYRYTDMGGGAARGTANDIFWLVQDVVLYALDDFRSTISLSQYVTSASLDRGLNNVSDALSSIIYNNTDNLQSQINSIRSSGTGIGDTVSQVVTDSINYAKESVNSVVETSTNWIDDTLTTVSNAFHNVYELTSNSVSALVSGLGDSIMSGIDMIRTIPSFLIEELQNKILPLMKQFNIQTVMNVIESSGFMKVADNLISGFWNGIEHLMSFDKESFLTAVADGFDIWMDTINRTMNQSVEKG